MRSSYTSKIIKNPLFRAGIALQCLSALLIGAIFLAIRLQWIDIVSLGLDRGIDRPGPLLEVLYWGFGGLTVAFASGFVFYALAFHRLRKAQSGAALHSGAAGTSRPSVS